MPPCDLAFAAHLHVVAIHGQRGIAGQRQGAETCVWTFEGDDCCSIEWRPTRSLVTVERGGGRVTGRWVALHDDARIAIGADLEVTGDAVWHGAGDDTHIGSIHGRGSVKDGVLTVDDDDTWDCEVRARRVGAYLVVVDNRHCGGTNVAFDGVYRRD